MAPVSVTFQVASFRQGSEAADLGSLLCFLINLKGCQEPLATAPAQLRTGHVPLANFGTLYSDSHHVYLMLWVCKVRQSGNLGLWVMWYGD